MGYRTIESQRKTFEWHHTSIALLVVITLGSAVSLIVLGVMVAKPTLHSARFKEATCRVVDWKYFGSRKCVCAGMSNDEPYCTSEYPCLSVIVEHEPWIPGQMNFTTLNVTSDEDTPMLERAILHDTEAELLSENSDCSFHYCRKNLFTNKLKVEIFRKKYGVVDSYHKCFYNPDLPEEVILNSYFDINDAILALVVPSAIFVVSLFLLTVLCCLAKKKSKREDKKLEEQGQLRQHLPRTYLATYDMHAFEHDEDTDPRPDPQPRPGIRDHGGDLGYANTFAT